MPPMSVQSEVPNRRSRESEGETSIPSTFLGFAPFWGEGDKTP